MPTMPQAAPQYDPKRDGIPCPRCNELLCRGADFLADVPDCQSGLFAVRLPVDCPNRYCPNCG